MSLAVIRSTISTKIGSRIEIKNMNKTKMEINGKNL